MKKFSEETKRRAVEAALTKPIGHVAIEFNCSYPSLYTWARQFGVDLKRMNRKTWDSSEISQLKSLAGTMQTTEIAKKLGRSHVSVKQKMAYLGISTAVKHKHLSRQDLDFIADNINTMTCHEMANYLNWMPQTIYSAARRMGLY